MKTYLRYYKTFANVPDEVLPELRRLNLGWAGVMYDLIPCKDHRVVTHYTGDYCSNCFDNASSQIQRWNKERHIVVAYDASNDKAVGWSVTDNSNAVNLYVQRKCRRTGVARKIATHMLKFLPSRIRVYNRNAEMVIRKATKRSKFKKAVGYM